MIRHALSPLFDPRSLVLIANEPTFVTPTLPESLRAALTEAEFDAHGVPALPPLRGVAAGERPDLAIVSVSAATLQASLDALSGVRPRAAVIHTIPSSGQQAAYCREWARAHDCALIGPHAFGMQRPQAGVNGSLHPSLATAGRVALVAQSGPIMAAVMEWADDTRTAFSAAIAPGPDGTVTLPAILDFLASDRHTDSIALYLEEVEHSRAFMSAMRAAASAKPVVVLKTGSLAPVSPDAAVPPDTAFDAAMRRAGALRVHFFVQLFSTIKALSHLTRPRGQRLALLANGEGQTRLSLDVVGESPSITLATLSHTTQDLLKGTLSPLASVGNPVVDAAPVTPAAIGQAVRHLSADAGVDGILILLTPDARSDLPGIAEELAQVVPQSRKPVITCLMGDASMRRLRRRLAEAGVPSFRTPETATDAFGQLARFHYNQQLLLQTQPPESMTAPPDTAAALAAIGRARAAGRRTLEADEVREVLAAFRMALAEAPAGHDPEEGVAARIRIGRDPFIGPVVSLHEAGSWPTSSSVGVELVPLNGFLARRLIERSPLWAHGLARHGTPVTLDKLEDVLIAVAELAAALPDVTDVLLEPVVLTDTEVVVQAAELRLSAEPADPAAGHAHLAIAPYPTRWVRTLDFADGTPCTLRPIRPEDAEPLQNFTRGLSEHTRYMRFISAMRELPPRMLARYTQIDYDRELAIVATVQQPNPLHRGHPHEVVIGVARYLRNDDGVGAEYALVIADAWQRRHLGPALMELLIEAAREQGLQYLEGIVLATNRPMIKLMTSLGFHNEPYPDDPTMRRIWLDLTAQRPVRAPGQDAAGVGGLAPDRG